MRKKFSRVLFFLFFLFCLGDLNLFAADNRSSDRELQSRIEILEQKIRLLQKEQELANIRLENCNKNSQDAYRAGNADDIKFHNSEVDVNAVSNPKVMENNGNDINQLGVKTELVVENEDLADLYNDAVEQIRLKNYENSSSMLKRIISVKIDEKSDKDTREIVANSHYLIGELSLKAKNYEQASNHFLSAYDQFTFNNKANIQGANSLYQLAKSLHMMDKKDGACNSLKKINAEFTKLPDNLKNKVDVEVMNLHCK